MAEKRSWVLISYDIRDPARWRKVYKLIRGFGERVQYSVFRCRLSQRELAQLRWELEKRLDAVDSLLVVGLCEGCCQRVKTKNQESWPSEEPTFRIV